MELSLQGKVALITGASDGIGRATARRFAKEGANLVLGARRKPALQSLANEIENLGGRASILAGDVQDEEFAKSLVNIAVSNFGGLDIAFNNAGTLGATGDVTSMKIEDWQTTLSTNLTSAFLGAKHQIPALLKSRSGSLIFTSSFVGYTVGLPGMTAYAASKAGLVGMTQCLAAENGPNGLRVNAILPGGTNTSMVKAFASTDEAKAGVASLHALKRLASPDEIARAVLFLASDAASFVTGSAMLVDGGNSIYKF